MTAKTELPALPDASSTPRDLGIRAEAIAVRALREAGYLIVETNWVFRDQPVKPATTSSKRRPRAAGCTAASGDAQPARQGRALGELDVIAWHGGENAILCFIEVRSRANADHGHAAEMFDAAKRRRVSRMAGAYLHTKGSGLYAAACRFDAVAITGDEIAILQDAWRLGLQT